MSSAWTGREVLSELGVPSVINAHNDLTGLGGSLPRGPVLEAMAVANQSFVEVERLSDAAGRAIAEMLGVEAALVTPGAAAAGITAARKNSYLAFEGPNSGAFGRHMKVGRSEIAGAYAALKQWLEMDHEARFRRYRRLMDTIADRLAGFSFLSLSHHDGSVTSEPKPPDSLRVTFDRSRSPKSLAEVVGELHAGEPCIILRPHYQWVDPQRDYLDIRVSTLGDGQEKIIADRLVEILGG